MKFDVRSINHFILWKIPIARIAGIRLRRTDEEQTVLELRHRWINQNPFGSVYFGVLVMGGELATGIPLFKAVSESGHRISMLVVHHQSTFTKKATGRIRFIFKDMAAIRRHLEAAIRSGEKEVFDLEAHAINENGDTVATLLYRWSVKRLD